MEAFRSQPSPSSSQPDNTNTSHRRSSNQEKPISKKKNLNQCSFFAFISASAAVYLFSPVVSGEISAFLSVTSHSSWGYREGANGIHTPQIGIRRAVQGEERGWRPKNDTPETRHHRLARPFHPFAAVHRISCCAPQTRFLCQKIAEYWACMVVLARTRASWSLICND